MNLRFNNILSLIEKISDSEDPRIETIQNKTQKKRNMVSTNDLWDFSSLNNVLLQQGCPGEWKAHYPQIKEEKMTVISLSHGNTTNRKIVERYLKSPKNCQLRPWSSEKQRLLQICKSWRNLLLKIHTITNGKGEKERMPGENIDWYKAKSASVQV